MSAECEKCGGDLNGYDPCDYCAVVEQRDDLLAALLDIQWANRTTHRGIVVSYCPLCVAVQERDEHNPDCVIGAAIAKATGDA